MSRRIPVTPRAAVFALVLVCAAAPLAARTPGAGSWKASGRGPATAEMSEVLDVPRRIASASRTTLPEPSPANPVKDVPSPPAAPKTLPHLVPDGSPLYLAGIQDLPLRMIPHVVVVGFHESGTRGALPMHPVGVPAHNDNMGRLGTAPVSLTGPEYVVMRTRNRYQAPTSSIDIAMLFNHPVMSPVTGTVVDASSYLLYGRVPDNLVMIRPDTRPDVNVVLMHVNGLKVTAGDRVVAGETPVALTARQLPFASQVDAYKGAYPHVHMEIRPAR